MKYPIALTLLAILMLVNWMVSSTDLSLFSFGFVSGICVASWIKYLQER
jgi:hypothetical protein